MALNDEAERLNTAEEYLASYAPHSQEYQAALEHVQWVYKNKPEYKARCEQIIKNTARRSAAAREEAKLRSLK